MVYNGTFIYKWMIWGYPHDLGNLHFVQINDQKWLAFHSTPTTIQPPSGMLTQPQCHMAVFENRVYSPQMDPNGHSYSGIY